MNSQNIKKALFPAIIICLIILAGCIFKATTEEENGNNGNGHNSVEIPEDGYSGKILSTPEGSPSDNYFKTNEEEYGIEAVSAPIIEKLNELKDSDKEVILWGDIVTDVADYAGQQIIVSRIDIPSDNFSLEWTIENNDDLGISFQYPKGIEFEVSDNAVVFDGWELEVLNNPKGLDFEDWLNANYTESIDKPCQITTTTDVRLGDLHTVEASIGEGDNCEELGIFAMSSDKQKILKLTLGRRPDKDYKEITKTIRFTSTLTPDEFDINESKKNGDNGDDAEVPNPASVFCEEQGGELEMRTDKKTKGTFGICIFDDDSECEEWTFYRGECQKGDNK